MFLCLVSRDKRYIRYIHDFYNEAYSFLTVCATQELAHEYIRRYKLRHDNGCHTYETYIGSCKDHAQFFHQPRLGRKYPEITMIIEEREI